MGFGNRWIDRISGLLVTSSTRVLVKSVEGAPIYNCIGLRQGDPISPMLHLAHGAVITYLCESGRGWHADTLG